MDHSSTSSNQKLRRRRGSAAGVGSPTVTSQKPRFMKASKLLELENANSKQLMSTDDENESQTSEIFPDKVIKKKFTWKNFAIRTLTTWAFMGFLYALVSSGHLYCIICVVLVQAELFRELVNVRYVAAKEKQMPWFRSLQWGWFVVPMFFTYGQSLHKFCIEHHELNQLAEMTKHVTEISFVLYCILFVASVSTLRKGLVRFQLSQHMWSVVTVCIVVFQLKFVAANILNGIFWFLFPMVTVATNDVFAYICGVTMGKKFINAPFIAMSPNKTWEGFLGAAVITIISSFFVPALFSQFLWIICPAESLYLTPFPPLLQCKPHSVFIPKYYDIPYVGNVLLYPMQFHGLGYGIFASLVAPFGGFFASAIKRAYKMKDFEELFPGHGGVMDRMDCQLFMAGFTAVHYYAFISPYSTPNFHKMLYLFNLMAKEDQLKFLHEVVGQVGLKLISK